MSGCLGWLDILAAFVLGFMVLVLMPWPVGPLTPADVTGPLLPVGIGVLIMTILFLPAALWLLVRVGLHVVRR